MKNAIKHFLFVGLLFAFIIGWILTILVNGVLGELLAALLKAPPENFFAGAAFLTLVSFALIFACELFGNRLFKKRFAPNGLQASSILISTILFTIIVAILVIPELSQGFHAFVESTYSHSRDTMDLLLGLSLPLARMIGLPGMYLLVAFAVLRPKSGS